MSPGNNTAPRWDEEAQAFISSPPAYGAPASSVMPVTAMAIFKAKFPSAILDKPISTQMMIVAASAQTEAERMHAQSLIPQIIAEEERARKSQQEIKLREKEASRRVKMEIWESVKDLIGYVLSGIAILAFFVAFGYWLYKLVQLVD